MEIIYHVNTSYWDWFSDEKYFLSRAHDILLVGFQERLSKDFEMLKTKLDLGDIELPKDDINTHKNPSDVDRNLSKKAISNLKKWYKSDYEFIDVCSDLFY